MDKNLRLSYFFAAMELLKVASSQDLSAKDKIINGKKCYEFLWITPNNSIFCVHIREEVSRKDRKLYLISTFEVQKKT